MPLTLVKPPCQVSFNIQMLKGQTILLHFSPPLLDYIPYFFVHRKLMKWIMVLLTNYLLIQRRLLIHAQRKCRVLLSIAGVLTGAFG